jgi:hypothetical protein
MLDTPSAGLDRLGATERVGTRPPAGCGWPQAVHNFFGHDHRGRSGRDARPMKLSAAGRGALIRAGRRDDQLRRDTRSGTLLRPVYGGYTQPVPIGPLRPAAYRYEHDAELRAACAAAIAVANPGAALADRTAAYLLCGLWPDSPVPQLVVPVGCQPSRRTGLTARQAHLDPEEITSVDGLRCTSALRTALDLGRMSSRSSALIAIDALLHTELVAPARLISAADTTTGRGVLQLRALARIADAGAESPGETLMRLPLVDAGIGPLETQVLVRGGAYRVDLVVDGCVLCEFEGSHHTKGQTPADDRVRFNDLAEIPGTRLLRFDWQSVSRTRDVVRRVNAALIALGRDSREGR